MKFDQDLEGLVWKPGMDYGGRNSDFIYYSSQNKVYFTQMGTDYAGLLAELDKPIAGLTIYNHTLTFLFKEMISPERCKYTVSSESIHSKVLSEYGNVNVIHGTPQKLYVATGEGINAYTPEFPFMRKHATRKADCFTSVVNYTYDSGEEGIHHTNSNRFIGESGYKSMSPMMGSINRLFGITPDGRLETFDAQTGEASGIFRTAPGTELIRINKKLYYLRNSAIYKIIKTADKPDKVLEPHASSVIALPYSLHHRISEAMRQ